MSTHRIVVGVANPSSVDPLTRMGCTLARANDGTVEIASISEIPEQMPVETGSDRTAQEEAIVERALSVADAHDVPAQGSTFPSHEPADSLVSLVDETDASALLLGTHETSPFERSLVGSTAVETVLERVDCDVYVECIGPEPVFPGESILVPVGPGTHAQTVVRVASAIARVHEMTVRLVTVQSPTAGPAEYERARQRLQSYAGPRVNPQVVVGEDVVEELVALTGEHDLTVLGATERTKFRQFLSGTVPTGLAKRGRNTLLMVDSDE